MKARPKLAAIAILAVSFVIIFACSAIHQSHAAADSSDAAKSRAAFMEVYKVLMSPRCMNCHPSGDIPLQGDDSHLHTMFPKRGSDGRGVYAMKCANCHQPTNTPGLHTPPGN